MQVLAGVGDEFFNFRIMREMFPGIITEAAKNTLVFTVISFTIGLGIGLGLALLRNSRFRAVRWSVAAVIDIFRGLPPASTAPVPVSAGTAPASNAPSSAIVPDAQIEC